MKHFQQLKRFSEAVMEGSIFNSSEVFRLCSAFGIIEFKILLKTEFLVNYFCLQHLTKNSYCIFSEDLEQACRAAHVPCETQGLLLPVASEKTLGNPNRN